jgi:DNA-binding HxlR family transcriptional regulator
VTTSAKRKKGPRGDLFDPACPTRKLLDRVGSKWVAMVVTVLSGAAGVGEPEVRFAELRRRMPGVSQKMLAQTLREMVTDGLVARRVEPTVPPAVHYSLTPLGTSLAGPVAVLKEWAEAHMLEVDRHREAAAGLADS